MDHSRGVDRNCSIFVEPLFCPIVVNCIFGFIEDSHYCIYFQHLQIARRLAASMMQQTVTCCTSPLQSGGLSKLLSMLGSPEVLSICCSLCSGTGTFLMGMSLGQVYLNHLLNIFCLNVQ